MLLRLFVGVALAAATYAQEDPNVPVVIRLEPPVRPKFLENVGAPRAIQPPVGSAQVPQPAAYPPQMPRTEAPQQTLYQQGALPPSPPSARQPFYSTGSPGAPPQQQFYSREETTAAPPPPVTIPPDVQNQLIKFFGLDSFGIPGLTGKHPSGFAGAVQELRAAGIPLAGAPVDQAAVANGVKTESGVLAQANPNFEDPLSRLTNEASKPTPYHGASAFGLPDEQPGENGLIGMLSNSIRKVFKETGVSDALSNSLPNLLAPVKQTSESNDELPESVESKGVGIHRRGGFKTSEAEVAESNDAAAVETASNRDETLHVRGENIRRQPSAVQRTLSGLAAALGGGGRNSPTHAGLPRIPGIPLLPGGIPRNSRGQIDVVSLIGAVTRRVSNGTTLADVIPAEQLQTLADNVTDALLPDTPKVDLSKFMGRWFEGINSPRATEQRCVVHHYGGLTRNEKTATFTALKIFREGSEFGPVRFSIGYAFRGGNKDAMLQLHSSETSDAQPFWIYKLGPEGKDPFGNAQYEYAIVSNWVKYPVTVLVRDPDAFKAKYQKEVLRWLEDQGFLNGFVRAFNLLQPAGYSSCQYADSTFEVFG